MTNDDDRREPGSQGANVPAPQQREQQERPERPDLAEELIGLADEDLAVRQRLLDTGELFGGYHPEMRAVHRRNGDRLGRILDELGRWPGHRLVGEEGSEAAFLIGQHDIANPTLIRRCRDLYEIAVRSADAAPMRLANLEDRIRSFEGRPQLYGTHVGWDDDGRFGPWPPVEAPDTVDDRRRALGLPPLADALEIAGEGRQHQRSAESVRGEHRQAERFAREAGWRADND